MRRCFFPPLRSARPAGQSGVPRATQRVSAALLGGILLAASPAVALAHTGPPPRPSDIWLTWSLDPSLLVPLLLASWLYLRGLDRVWRRPGEAQVHRWQAQAYFAGLATVFIALVSPLDGLSSALFSAHMVQHLLLILVAAPLLMLGSPLLVWFWGLPLTWRRWLAVRWNRLILRRVWRALTVPVVAWLVASIALWLWHAPPLYEAALRNQAIHSFEHITLLGTAFIFWYVAFRGRRHARLSYGAAIVFLFTAAAQCSLLGILIAVSPPWYPTYAASAAAWNLAPQQDQQIAGLIMWIPAGAAYLLAALALLARWTLADAGVANGQPDPTKIRGARDAADQPEGAVTTR
jgi:putative membrane protein